MDYQDYDRERKTASFASDHTFSLDYTELAAQSNQIDLPRGRKMMNIVESPVLSHANDSTLSLPCSTRAGMSFQSFLALSSDSRSSSSCWSMDLPSDLQGTPIDNRTARKSESRYKDRSRRFRRIIEWRKKIMSHFHKIWQGRG